MTKESNPVNRFMMTPTIKAIAAEGPKSVTNQRRRKAARENIRQIKYSYLTNSIEA
jgi:hypothetical protein